MKTTLSSIVALLLAANAVAHTAALPHAHDASGTNWTAAIACVATLCVAILTLAYVRRRSSK